MCWCFYLMDLQSTYHVQALQYTSLAIVMVMQEKDPWNETYSSIPIVLSFIALLLSYQFRKEPVRLDYAQLKKGCMCLIVAICCFIRGLDDGSDPYRFFHGCWHAGVGTASLYFFYAVPRPKVSGILLPMRDISKHF